MRKKVTRVPGEMFYVFVEVIKHLDRSSLLADWIEDKNPTHPEASLYVERLREKLVTMSTLVEAVAKFGDKMSRRLIRRVMRKVFRHSRRAYQHAMRVCRAYEGDPSYKQIYAIVVGSYD